MIDAEYVGFLENTKQNLIQLLRRGKIVPEGLLHNNSTTSGAVGFRKMLHHRFKQNRRYRQVMRWTLCVLEFFAKRGERRGILIVAVHIAQQAGQFLKSSGIESAVLLETVLRASAKLIDLPSSLGDSNDGNIQMSSLHHCLQRRKNLL